MRICTTQCLNALIVLIYWHRMRTLNRSIIAPLGEGYSYIYDISTRIEQIVGSDDAPIKSLQLFGRQTATTLKGRVIVAKQYLSIYLKTKEAK